MPAFLLRARVGCLLQDLLSEFGWEASEVECDREVGREIRIRVGDEGGGESGDNCSWLTHDGACD